MVRSVCMHMFYFKTCIRIQGFFWGDEALVCLYIKKNLILAQNPTTTHIEKNLNYLGIKTTTRTTINE